tara:strand:- start:11186 stop:14170 length:2985 start_codon:yes stop_codon:yes gene_type:complete
MSQPATKKITIKLPKEKTIKFRGVEYKYRKPKGLALKLNITEDQAKSYIKDFKNKKTTRYLQNKAGDIAKYNLKDKPIIFKDFGVKRIDNKALLKGQIKDVKISKTGFNGSVNVIIKVSADILFSPPNIEIKEFSKNVIVNPNKVSNKDIKPIIAEHFKIEDDQVDKFTYEIFSTLTEKKYDIVNGELRKSNPTDISNLYNEVIPNKNGRCIQDYLNKIYPKYSSKEIEQLKTTTDLYDYSVKHRIKMIAYDINGNIIKSHYPTQHNKSRKNLIYIHYNNHLYPIKNQVLHKKKPMDVRHVINTPDIKDKLIDLLEMGILPCNVYAYGNEIKKFQHEDKIFIDNPDYEICKDILHKFGLSDQMTYFTTLINVGDIISKLYSQGWDSVKSFIPVDNNFCKPAINYNNDEEINSNENLITIDKNKAYSYALTQLPYLIKVDMKTAKVSRRNIRPDDIIPHYWYIADPKHSTNLIDNQNVYDGEHLIYCNKKGIEFDILEEIETTKHFNFYKKMVVDLYHKIDPTHAKKIINAFIGRLERNRGVYLSSKFVKICNKEEADTFTGFKNELNDEFVICSESITNIDIDTYIPIAYQIKDYVKRCMYDKMEELNIKSKDIIQMKTDSITFRSNNFNKKSKFINKTLGGWKFEVFKPIKSHDVIKNFATFELFNMNENKLFQQYAGGGKTYNIINNVIPEMNNYKILSPSHISIAEYRRKGLNCDVIQAYTLQNRIPIEDTIIIDEYGMLDSQGWNLIYKCILLEKNIMCWGDYQQLLPVGSKKSFNNINWINYCFKDINTDWINRRNNFTQKQYDSLINETCDVKKIVNKYSTKTPDEAEVIIVHRNETRHKYNEYICNIKNIKSLTDIGAEIICLTNDLRKHSIYNKYCFTVKEIKNDKVIIYNKEFDKCFELTKEEIENNFDYSYARTIYNIQGQTINSYYWASEDNFFLDGRMSYTIVSRLRQKIKSVNKSKPTKRQFLLRRKDDFFDGDFESTIFD